MTRQQSPRLSNPDLWARIAGAFLPVEADGRGFAAHVAALAGLEPHAARRLVDEYRRFLYLAATRAAPLAPPARVWVVWDYHASLDGYRDDFCTWILGRDLPCAGSAGPGAPGYAAARAAYAAEFGPPPLALWPRAEAPVRV